MDNLIVEVDKDLKIHSNVFYDMLSIKRSILDIFGFIIKEERQFFKELNFDLPEIKELLDKFSLDSQDNLDGVRCFYEHLKRVATEENFF